MLAGENAIINSPANKLVMQKWAKRIAITEKVHGKALSLEKKLALAKTLENTNQRLLQKEATQPGNIGQYKRYALDIVNAVVPNLIAPEIIATQAIDNRVGMINYISYLYSNDKGATKRGDMFASSINMGASDQNYSKARVDQEILGAQGETTYEGNLAWTPVTPGTVVVTAGTVIGTDDGQGHITGTGITTGTIDYATGKFALTFESATTMEVVAAYGYNLEDAPIQNVPEVELRITSLPVIAETRKLKTIYAFDAAYELEKEYGQDIDSLLATEISGEISHEIDIEICRDLLKMADGGADLAWSKTQPVGVNNIDHYDSFYTTLEEGAYAIFQATRKVRPNFLVVGTSVAAVIKVMRQFTPSGTVEVGPHFIGTLGDFRVYVNPDYDPMEFVMGYKGASFMDAGYFYCPYMPIISTDLVMLADFAGQKGWATMYAKKMVNNKMYLKGRITA